MSLDYRMIRKRSLYFKDIIQGGLLTPFSNFLSFGAPSRSGVTHKNTCNFPLLVWFFLLNSASCWFDYLDYDVVGLMTSSCAP